MAIGDPLNAGIGVYNPNKNNFAKPPPRGGGLLGSGGLNIKTVPGQSKMDALNAMRERLGMQPLSENSSPAFSIAPTGMTKSQAKQQQMTVGDYDIGRKLAALNRPNTMTQVTSALQDDPGNIFLDGQSVFTTGDFDITADPIDIETYGSTVQQEPVDPELEAKIEREERGDFGDDGLIKDISTSDSKKPNETEAEFNARIEREERGIFDEDTSGAGAGAGSGAGSGGQKRGVGSGSIDLMKSALDSYNDMVGLAPSGAKSMSEYKKEFSEATGIDISGDPDNKAALTAFGLALMQNKAGKGFNVGNILSEVGAAGEKALPIMAQARKEAREGKIAAGKYALGKAAEADASKQKFLVDQSIYLRNRKDKILDYMQTRRDTLDDDASKQEFDRHKLAVEYGFKTAKARNDALIKADEDKRKGSKVDSQYNRDIQYTQRKIRVGFTDDGSREIYANPRMDGADIANDYVKVQRSQEAMGKLDVLLSEMESADSPSGKLLMDRGKDVLIALGVSNPDKFYKDNGVSPEDNANAILNVLIMENKRFATQETGNGISNQDRQDLAESFGKPGQLAANPRAARIKLAELRSIFNAPLASIEQELSNFYELKDMYRNEDIYNQTTSKMDEILAASPYNKIPNEPGDDGVIRFGQGDY